MIVAVLGLIVLLVGPFVTRYVRALGKVQCTVDFWYPQRIGFSPGGSVAEKRRLQVTFSNRKDVPVTVSEMRVEFYKEGQPSRTGHARTCISWMSTTGRARSAQ
jgi:hypothetical protein